MRTYVYVDGFNLYYRALKGTTCKWIDLPALFKAVLHPQHQILAVKYFTARVNATPADPSKPQRQDVYLRALQAYRAEVEIHFGHFLSHTVKAPLANPGSGPKYAEIIKTEEKGSDVNLAVHLLNDAWQDKYDCAIVVSNDSDIAESMRLVKAHCQKRVGLLTPGSSHPSRQLLAHSDFSRHIRISALQSSQLPDPIPGTKIRKPTGW
ncbi:MAG: NYN domain-containing protein [Rhodospirillales bacterium]|jgi:uncharacterized LabA/DUF88 family protein|nr:NYN domain-containing protein [Rhodospirillales bacterium]